MSLKFANNNSLSAIDTKPSGLSGGALNLISTQTASSSSTISFTSNIDSTYKEYIFKFIQIHPSAESRFVFQTSTDSGSSYGVTATTTFFQAYHTEDSSAAALTYTAVEDFAQSTDFIHLGEQVDPSGNDQNSCGYLQLFDPSSTTFVKHFMSRQSQNYVSNYLNNPFVAGYFNTTSAIDAVQFKFESGNIDAGDICLYGIL